MPRILKQDAQKILANVSEEFVFRSQDGRVLANMNDLNNALDSMSDETFAFHVNETKNDFANWVRDVIRDEKLARDLGKAKNKLQAAKSTAERLGFLRDKLT